MILALKNAEFVRYGVMHRNTYLNSPKLLDRYYRLRSEPRISFAGQMTGVEGMSRIRGLRYARRHRNGRARFSHGRRSDFSQETGDRCAGAVYLRRQSAISSR